MNEANKVIKKLMNSVVRLITAEIKRNNQSVTYVALGRIVSVDGNDKFRVEIREKEYQAKSHFNHNVGDFVKVVVENGNLQNLTIIY